MIKRCLFISMIFLMLLFLGQGQAQVVINEFLAINKNCGADEYGEYDDWVEIYNAGTDPVDIGGIYITDDLTKPQKWRIPNSAPDSTTIPAGGFLVLWCDKESEQGILHVEIKLKGSGEQIGLFDETTPIDTLSFDVQKENISYGRLPDGGNNFFFCNNPTPGAENDMSSSLTLPPDFSHQNGFYSNSFNLTLTADNSDIYYTLDYHDPTEQSLLYNNPIEIDSTVIVRAIASKRGFLPGETISHSYFFGYDLLIPTISLVTDPSNLWGPAGIYDNPLEKWGRPVSIEYFNENGSPAFTADAEIKIHGGETHRLISDKKNLRLHLRLPYPIFGEMNIEYYCLVLRAGGIDKPDLGIPGWSLILDPIAQQLAASIGVIGVKSRPACVFLNGEQWGIYNMSPRIDKDYFDEYFNEPDVDIIEYYPKVFDGDGYNAKEGTLENWENTLSFIKNHNFASDENFSAAEKMINIYNMADYFILNIWGGNKDWPHKNILSYRFCREGTKWNWITWDADYWFTSGDGTLYRVMYNDGGLILRKLLENSSYKNYFLNRFCDLLNTIFLPDNMRNIIDSLSCIIENDISFETDKWGSTPTIWKTEGIEGKLYDFVDKRPEKTIKMLKNVFEINDTFELTINKQTGGAIQVNTIIPVIYPWAGTYLDDIPLTLKACPEPGYLFSGWSDNSLPDSATITINKNNNYSVSAYFKEENPPEIIINEFNYNSADNLNPDDWVEFYNPSENSVNITGWCFKDSEDEHCFTFPQGTIIGPDSFLVLCRNDSLFQVVFPQVDHIGNFDFGLSGGGEAIRLYSRSNLLIDSVNYDDEFPWPVEADGNGATLELIDWKFDNSLSKSWKASQTYGGSPGRSNPVFWGLSGNIIYYSGERVPGAVVKLSGQIKDSSATNTYGGYQFPELPHGTHLIVKPEKYNGVNCNIITPGDAAVALTDTLNCFQKIAADVDGDSTVTTADGLAILRYYLCIIDKFEIMPDLQSNWKFIPEEFDIDENNRMSAPDSIEYTSLISDTTGHFIGVVYGDVDGNWVSTEISLEPDGMIEFSIPIIQPVNNNWLVAIKLTFPDEEIYSGSFKLLYSSELEFLSCTVDSSLTNVIFAEKNSADGINFAFASRRPLSMITINMLFNGENKPATNNFECVDVIVNDKTTDVVVSSVAQPDSKIPKEWGLNQNYPNPFNPETTIKYQLKETRQVSITVYNMLGQEIIQLVNEKKQAGYHTVEWDRLDKIGNLVCSGIYIYRIEAGNFVKTKKMMLMK